ncbi:MAG: DUF1800 domain-containing protein [Rubrivivax sp.]|jgi:uncharacterized protein (DUF1800 family)|nr:DUF1800 domain-containing protein [Rubrivivax sp.]
MSRTPDTATAAQRAAVAAHRFGLGEASLAAIGGDAQGWLLAQIGPATPQRGDDLVSGAEGARRLVQFFAQQAQARQRPPEASVSMEGSSPAPRNPSSTEAQFGEHFRSIVQGDVRARLATAATSVQPFNERLALFWANHFTVSMAKASARGMVGAFEREAIRPHIAGSFATLLKASTTHAGMLRYLDNEQSAGPNSRIVQRGARLAERRNAAASADAPAQERRPRVAGLNENLAREVLELHTLGAAGGGATYFGGHDRWGGYTQADVTELARILTGWRVPVRELMRGGADIGNPTRFDDNWHDPGDKSVLGRRYGEGEAALGQVLDDLARHPSTARYVSFKLARHFVADEPPAALVQRMAQDFIATGGDLPSLYRTLVQSPEAWEPQPAKLKTPEEFVVSTARLLKLGERAFERPPDGGIAQLGQRVQAAPSPAGWPEAAAEWLGPDAVWKRIEWATRVADRLGRQTDARSLARASLGPRLSEQTALQIERAADGPQALALLLLAPEFQRR